MNGLDFKNSSLKEEIIIKSLLDRHTGIKKLIVHSHYFTSSTWGGQVSYRIPREHQTC